PDFAASPASRAPRTPQEAILCELFAEVLDVDHVGIDDGFFDRGGDSILSLRVVSRARQAGLSIAPRDLFQHQSVAALAGVADPIAEASVPTPPDAAIGAVPPTPIIHWLLEQDGPIERFHQGMLLRVPATLEPDHLTAALQTLLDHHDALRLRLARGAG